jgi:hypothetical protein
MLRDDRESSEKTEEQAKSSKEIRDKWMSVAKQLAHNAHTRQTLERPPTPSILMSPTDAGTRDHAEVLFVGPATEMTRPSPPATETTRAATAKATSEPHPAFTDNRAMELAAEDTGWAALSFDELCQKLALKPLEQVCADARFFVSQSQLTLLAMSAAAG